jgi:hypothetical protein
MTNNGLDIQTISTKQTDFQTDRVLLLDQVTEKKAKVNPSHFLKFLIASRTNGTFASRTSRHTNPSLQKSQFSHPPHHDNDRFKGEKSYLDRQKIELN